MSKLTRNIMDLLESESSHNKKSLLVEASITEWMADEVLSKVNDGVEESKAIKMVADTYGYSEEDVRASWEAYQGLDKEPDPEEIDENAGIDMVTDIAASNINLGKTVMGMNEEELKEAIGDTEKAAQDLEDSISGIAMPEILVPGDDGALADINFIYDTIEVDPESGEQRSGEVDLEKLTAEVQQVLSQYITNIESVVLNIARKKNGMLDISGSVIGKDLEEASADLNIGAKVDVPDEVVGAAAGALMASEKKEAKEKKLDEIGPLAAATIGAAAGAMLNKKEETAKCKGKSLKEEFEVPERVESVIGTAIDSYVEDDEMIDWILGELDVEDPEDAEAISFIKANPDVVKKVYLEMKENTDEFYDEADKCKGKSLKEELSDEEPAEDNAEECEACEDEEKIASILADEDNKDLSPEDLAKLILDSIKPEEEHEECLDGDCEDSESEDKINIDMIDEAEEIKEYLEEDEAPAAQADFAHTTFDEVSSKVEQISELKKNDTENELYTALLASYDKILSQLKEYIGDQPVQTPQEPIAPVEEPVEAPEGETDEVIDTTEEISTEEV